MAPRNLISIFLTALLVFNATCACASMSDMTMSSDVSEAHHHPDQDHPDQALSADDCLQTDCASDCTAAVATLVGENTAQLPSFKFELDIDDAAVLEGLPVVRRFAPGTTGPPTGRLPLAADTPVGRFEVQLK